MDEAIPNPPDKPAETIKAAGRQHREVLSTRGRQPKAILSLRGLGDLDEGHFSVAIDNALLAIGRDIRDRGVDKRVRRLAIIVEVKPIVDKGRVLALSTTAKLKTSIPDEISAPTAMELHGTGLIGFNPSSPDDPRQSTIDEEINRQRPS